MGTKEAVYSLVAFASIILAMVLFFVDGALFWSIGFFVLAILMVLFKVMWNTAGWAERMTRKLGDGD